ncbi:MAG TPA: polysaccharide biosynthesis/export family protein [Longimicrobium sp.]|nr:polysaccharide biosynthesis/export family protein [Longimicrobium sp.]
MRARTPRFHAVLPALAALALAVFATAAGAQGASPPAGSGSAMAASAPAGLIPGDVVRVRVWREPDLSGDFTVDENGTVVLPRLGRISAAAEAPAALRDRVTRGYTAFLSHSSVEVTLLRRVQILGAVRNPGLYPVDATMTLGDALALAGGTTPQGHPDRVVLVHRDGGGATVSRRTLVGDSPLRSGDHLYVPERGWASRNPGVVVGMVTAALGLIATLTR